MAAEIDRYADLCRWLAEMFPAVRLFATPVIRAFASSSLCWGKIGREDMGSIVVYGVKKEFWETTVAPKFREEYPEVVIVSAGCERQILTLSINGPGPFALRLWPVLAYRLGWKLYDVRDAIPQE
jgi:hypothetical protein